MPKLLIVNSLIKHFHLKHLLLVLIRGGKCQASFDFFQEKFCYTFVMILKKI